MPNQKSIPAAHHYAALTDAYDMAESDLSWLETALNHVRNEILKLKEKAKNGTHLDEHYFTELVTFLDMYSYLAEERCRWHTKLAKEYDEKFKAAVKEGDL